MDLKKRLTQLEQQAEQVKSSFLQIQGAIALLKEQIAEEEKPKTEEKKEEKK